MNCATPSAPAELTDLLSNPLSCQIRRTKKATGRALSSADDASNEQSSSCDSGEFDRPITLSDDRDESLSVEGVVSAAPMPSAVWSRLGFTGGSTAGAAAACS